ncbi:MAG: Rho termination factor N-terminal domain-containing protein, partial [Rhodococcus sp. (in: high G+C Gram-positive bacteria)]
MTDTELISAPEKTRRGAGLSGMVLTELRGLAGELGIKSISGMRKGDLIAAISARQGANAAPAAEEAPKASSRRGGADKTRARAASTPETSEQGAAPAEATAPAETAAPVVSAAPQTDDAA